MRQLSVHLGGYLPEYFGFPLSSSFSRRYLTTLSIATIIQRRQSLNEWVLNTDRILLAGENRNTRRKSGPNATLSTTNSTWSGPGLNPGLPGEMPAPKLLNRGMAVLFHQRYASSTDAQYLQQLTWESKYHSLPAFLSLYSIAAHPHATTQTFVSDYLTLIDNTTLLYKRTFSAANAYSKKKRLLA